MSPSQSGKCGSEGRGDAKVSWVSHCGGRERSCPGEGAPGSWGSQKSLRVSRLCWPVSSNHGDINVIQQDLEERRDRSEMTSERSTDVDEAIEAAAAIFLFQPRATVTNVRT